MLDIDHYGKTEQKIILKLEELGFKGIVLLDDIHIRNVDQNMNEAMRNLWDWVSYPNKHDVTRYGHWSGTGIFTVNMPHLKFSFPEEEE